MPINKRLEELDKKIIDTEGIISKIKDIIGVNSNSRKNITAKPLLLLTLYNYQSTLVTLSGEKNRLRILLSQTEEFMIFSPPMVSERPVKPKIAINIAISGVLSIILGMLVAFFMEFWQKLKRK